MASVVTSPGLGLHQISSGLASGNPLIGRNGQSDRVYVNSATGNLVVQAHDEVLASLGPDLGLLRTYNSQGLFSDDNGDNWLLGVQRRLQGLVGTVNTPGSSITKVFEDGSESVFTYDAALGYYTSTDGDGPHDILRNQAGTWT